MFKNRRLLALLSLILVISLLVPISSSTFANYDCTNENLLTYIDAENGFLTLAPKQPQKIYSTNKPTFSLYISSFYDDLFSKKLLSIQLDGKEVTFAKNNDSFYSEYVYTSKTKLKDGDHTLTISFPEENQPYVSDDGVCEFFNPTPLTYNFKVKYVDPFEDKDRDALQQNRIVFLKALNGVRVNMGLSKVTTTAILNRAAQAHSNYLYRHEEYGSLEVAKNRGFTGLTPFDRMSSFGLIDTPSTELIAYISSGESAFKDIIDAPYQRFSLVDPYLKNIGNGSNKGSIYRRNNVTVTSVFDDEEKAKLKLKKDIFVYPYDKQEGISLTWGGFDDPDPLRHMKNEDESSVGYPITISAADNFHTFTSVSIKRKKYDVKFYQLDHTKDENLAENQLILFPRNPLRPKQTYLVTVNYEVLDDKGKKVKKKVEWSFKTK